MSGLFLNDQLSKHTSIFGLRLWVVLGVCVGAAIVIVLFLISIWVTSRRNNNNNSNNYNNKKSKSSKRKSSHKIIIPNVSKEIQEIRVDHHSRNPTHHQPNSDSKSNQSLVPVSVPDSDPLAGAEEENSAGGQQRRIHIEIGKDHRISYPERGGGSSHASGEARSGDQAINTAPEVSHLGWGHWYTLRELEDATNGFADENVIGEGGYGIVYSGILVDNSQVAVKNLLNNK